MKFEGFKCDECGVEKKQANHWFIVAEQGNGVLLAVWYDNATDCRHICGQSCMQKVLDRWMTKGAL